MRNATKTNQKTILIKLRMIYNKELKISNYKNSLMSEPYGALLFKSEPPRNKFSLIFCLFFGGFCIYYGIFQFLIIFGEISRIIMFFPDEGILMADPD